MARLLCNNCFQPLETVEYDIGIFIEPCGCHIDRINKEWEEKIKEAEHEAYREGQWDGEEDGRNEGYDQARGEFEDQIKELEEKLDKYQDLIDDDEYNERIGA